MANHRLFPRRDSPRTQLPVAARLCLLDIVESVLAIAALQSQQVPLLSLSQLLHRADRHHATVAHEYHSLQLESLVQVLHHFVDRGLIQTVAGKHMMGNRQGSLKQMFRGIFCYFSTDGIGPV